MFCNKIYCFSKVRVITGTPRIDVQTLGNITLAKLMRTNVDPRILQALLQKPDLIPALNWNETSTKAILMYFRI